jgi:nitroreductase
VDTDRDNARAVTDALAEAVTVAGHAPSIHNTQPWRWRPAGDALDLYIEHSRVLEVSDPDMRLATISCGAALHHARTALAAGGWHATVARMPDAADQDQLAHVRVDGRAPADPDAVRLLRAIPLRHTDRQPVTGAPVVRENLHALTVAVEAEGAWLHVLKPDQVLDLASAADRAQRAEAADPAWQAELEYWTGGTRPTGVGLPDAVIPRAAPRTTVPGRDFGHPGDLPISSRHDRAATFAILDGRSDEPGHWLRAGEALSAAWLTATDRGISVLPLSAPVEVIGTRDTLRRLLAYLNHPYLVLRFGTVDRSIAGSAPTPRLRPDQIIERP